MSKTKQTLYGILKGNFLVDKDAQKNWGFIIFLTSLALLMIGSSHNIDKKVQKPIFILDSYGKSPFIIYIIAVVLEFIISDIIGLDMDFIIFTIMVIVMTLIALLLDKRGKIIKL